MKKDEFLIYGYHNPGLGKYSHNVIGEERYLKNKEFFDSRYSVEKSENSDCVILSDAVYDCDKKIKDFRTKKYFSYSKKCGMNILFLQKNTVIYNGEEFSESELKKILDIAYSSGNKKIIIYDERLHALSSSKESLVGQGKTFVNQEELERYCLECVKPYKNHKGFYGIYLSDEPDWKTLPQVCAVQKALQKVCPDIFIQENLLPLAGDAAAVTGQGKTTSSLFVDTSAEENNGITLVDAYRKYIETYVSLSGSKILTMDSYPIRAEGPYEDAGHYNDPDYYVSGNVPEIATSYFVLNSHFRCLQLMGETGKKFNVRTGGVANSCGMAKVRNDNDNVLVWSHKPPDIYDMIWQINAYLCFGFSVFSYYVYWAKRDNGPGCYHIEGTAFIDQNGERTPIYFEMKKLHKKMQKIAPVMLKYKYDKMSWCGDENLPYLKNCPKDDLDFIKVSLNKGESAVITQLSGEEGKLYCVMNSCAPSANGADVGVSVNIKLDTRYKDIKRFDLDNKPKKIKNDITFTLNYGQAVFIVAK